MTATEEILKICSELPAEKQAEIADFARFLLARQQDVAWEADLSTNKPRARLEAFIKESVTEEVSIQPTLAPGEGLRRAFGSWSDDPEGLDEFLKQVRRGRGHDHT